MRSTVKVHRFQASLFPVNAYLVETATSVVAIDATLGVSDGRAMRARADALGKPLVGVIVTHTHPDHYGGVASLLGGDDVPVYAVEGVDRVIRRDDAAKERILRPMFGAEWAEKRTFPTRVVRDGDQVPLDGATFRVLDVGPSESPHDSWWLLDADGPPQAFIGDLVYNHMHAYLADGFAQQWLSNLERPARVLPRDAQLLMGHGEPSFDHTLFAWQAGYIRRFLTLLQMALDEQRVQGEALADLMCARMQEYLPGDDLLFLLRLSVEPMRERLIAAQAGSGPGQQGR
ncbi:MAG: MBL fold metallo-hydrolase [Betaproteobacteria bacterium]